MQISTASQGNSIHTQKNKKWRHNLPYIFKSVFDCGELDIFCEFSDALKNYVFSLPFLLRVRKENAFLKRKINLLKLDCWAMKLLTRSKTPLS